MPSGPGIQSWWDSNDWLTKMIWIFIKNYFTTSPIVKPRDLIMISNMTREYDVTKGNVIK